MNKPVDVTPIIVMLPQNHNYAQHRQSEHLAWDQVETQESSSGAAGGIFRGFRPCRGYFA